MPVISEFFGIKITMFWNEHMPPHFHAEFWGPGGYSACIGHKRRIPIQDELMRNWERTQQHIELQRVDPLV